MGKYKTSPKKQAGKKTSPAGIVLVVILSITLAALLMMFVIPQALYQLRHTDTPEEEIVIQEPTPAPEPTETTAPAEEPSLLPQEPLLFPVALDDGKLVVSSMFSHTGIHPEKSDENVSDLAALLVENTSGKYLAEANITATLSDGTVCSFTVTDLPADKTITLFAEDDETFTADDSCVDLSSEAVFEDAVTPDQLSVTAMGMDVMVENTSGEELTNIDIYCRDILGESYFGGAVYKHTIENLSAGQTATVTVSESFVGMVEVVRIAINES